MKIISILINYSVEPVFAVVLNIGKGRFSCLSAASLAKMISASKGQMKMQRLLTKSQN